MKNLHLTLVPFGIALLVAGCGGGGSSSSSGSSGSTAIPTAAIKITATNANTVAASSNSASQSTARQGTSSSKAVVGAVTQQTAHLPSVLQIATGEFKRALNTKLPPATVVGATQSLTYDCGTGAQATAGAANTFTMTLNLAGNTFAAGDNFSMSYNACVDTVAGTTTNGSMTFAVNSLTGSLGTVGASSSFTVTFANFAETVTATGASFSMNGDMTISASSTGASAATAITTSTISGTSFTMTDSVNGSIQMTNYNETVTDNAATGAYSYSTNMTVAGTQMGGSVTITTTTPFTGVGTGNPSAGVMRIDGASGSYVTLTTIDSTNVSISGSDGTTAFGPTTVAWTAL